MLRQATAAAESACAADAAGDRTLAYAEYTRACNLFNVVLDNEKNAQTKTILLGKVATYVRRAEELKNQLQPAMAKQQPTKAAAQPKTNMQSVPWSDIAGLHEAKRMLVESVVLPVQHPSLFEFLKPWRAILLYGPPGTGKTQLARAAATASSMAFYAVSASAIVSKWMGDSEKAILDLFQQAAANAGKNKKKSK